MSAILVSLSECGRAVVGGIRKAQDAPGVAFVIARLGCFALHDEADIRRQMNLSEGPKQHRNVDREEEEKKTLASSQNSKVNSTYLRAVLLRQDHKNNKAGKNSAALDNFFDLSLLLRLRLRLLVDFDQPVTFPTATSTSNRPQPRTKKTSGGM